MKKEKILGIVISSNKNVQFAEFIRLVEAFVFELDRISGSHHIFKHPDIIELVNIQTLKERSNRIRLINFYQSLKNMI